MKKKSLESLKIEIITFNEIPSEKIDFAPVHDNSLTYVLYTSGSTGKPKGVCMGNNALVNLLQWQSRNSVAVAGTKTLQFAPLTFDVSFQEIFATLTTGGALVLINEVLRTDPYRLLEYIGQQKNQPDFFTVCRLAISNRSCVCG